MASNEELLYALEAGKQAAMAAAQLLMECYRIRYHTKGPATAFNDSALGIEEKTGDTDLVTKYDKDCEDIIIKTLLELTPSYEIISEERNPTVPLTDAPTWIIDPIDGTMDFVHGLMDCCVSIGLAVGKKPTLGIVYCPFVGPTEVGELVYGGKLVGGAWLNGKPLRTLRPPRDMSDTIVALNMPWRHSTPAIEAASEIRRELMAVHKVRAIRMYGAAVFQEVQVALGRIDGYSEPGGKIWDVAAGAALIEAVGGTVLALDGSPFDLEAHTISCGSSSSVAETMASLCKKYDFYNQYWA